MNYIAHIHLAHATNTSLVGNFLGDFVKGSDLSHLPPQLRQGVKLHRKIDSFTDNHEISVKTRKMFPPNIRRMSGVILDVYFDHLLCKHWDHFSSESFEAIMGKFYAELAVTQFATGRFTRVQTGLLRHKWLHTYHDVEGYQQAFSHIETRLKNKVSFASEAVDFINVYRESLLTVFLDLYPMVLDYSTGIVKADLHN